MTTTSHRDRLVALLGRLTRLDSLLIYAALNLRSREVSGIAQDLPNILKEFSDESPEHTGRTFAEGGIRISAEQIAAVLPTLPAFTIDLLLVDLEALVHGFLADLVGLARTDDSQPLEKLLARLWPKEARRKAQDERLAGKDGPEEHWSYREIILLSEIRNAIVHGDGRVDPARDQRLKNAGWTNDELAQDNLRQILEARGFNDFLRFKRASRTLLNEVISFQESSGEQQ